MRMELGIYGKVLHGKNLFLTELVAPDVLDLECVHVVNSLVYQARKMLVNRPLTTEEKVRMMKFCIYAVLYALATHQLFPSNKTEAMKEFHGLYGDDMDPKDFLLNKVFSTESISDAIVHQAYNFLEKLDHIIFAAYLKKYHEKY